MRIHAAIGLVFNLCLAGCGPGGGDASVPDTLAKSTKSIQNDLLIEWNTVQLASITGYRVYRDAQCPAGLSTNLIATVPQGPMPNYEDKTVPNGQKTACYDVTSVDVSGVESPQKRLQVSW